MSDSARTDEIARRAAARLAADLGPALPAQVERELARDPLERPAERFLDPISLGALVVSVASLGWTVYHDLKEDRAKAGRDRAAEAERLSARLREGRVEAGRLPRDLTPERHDLVIRTVAEEVVAAGGSP